MLLLCVIVVVVVLKRNKNSASDPLRADKRGAYPTNFEDASSSSSHDGANMSSEGTGSQESTHGNDSDSSNGDIQYANLSAFQPADESGPEASYTEEE